MPTPQFVPSTVPDGDGPGLRYRIEGQLVPTLHLAVNGTEPVQFEHHVLLWKQPQVDVQLMKMKGAFKRVLSGMPIFMTHAVGAGEIAFSRDFPGQVIPLHLDHGETIQVREHQFLAAAGLDYTFERAGGFGTMLLGSQGFFIDRFTASRGPGVLFLHAHGNAQIFDLEPGEVIDVEPGAWVYKEARVGYAQQVFGLRTGMFGGGGNIIWNRFTGPGRVCLQSGYYEGQVAAAAGGAAAGSRAGLGGGLLGGALGGILGGSDPNP
ncbi:MAG TPA: AIM24 family protein [Mycobacteriales bacterium]|jgi:uncharacterized protein (AIM24 family)|nr:AIM24 family protein [Mycobacteriales bacterium]